MQLLITFHLYGYHLQEDLSGAESSRGWKEELNIRDAREKAHASKPR